MEEEDLGTMIRSMRIKKQLSQERLAGGICATSTLSQIENGSREPTRDIVNKLMAALGEPSFSYEDYYSARSLKQKKLSQKILVDVQRRDTATAEKDLEEFASCTLSCDVAARQMYFFLELVCQMMRGDIKVASKEFATQCENILQLRESTCEKLVDRQPLNKAEKLLLNAEALSRGLIGDYAYEEKTYVRLLDCNCRNEADLLERNTISTVIYNNVSVVFLQRGKYERALEYVNKALKLCYDSAGIRMLMQVLQTRMAINFKNGNMLSYHEDYLHIRDLCRLLPAEQSPEKFSDWLDEPSGILIF